MIPGTIGCILEKINSKFIPQDRTYLFEKGILYGIENDFNAAAHILLPQIENSLRYIAHQKEIITTQLSQNLQQENTLGGTLEKLKGEMSNDLWSELDHFLASGCNFRNNVMHGLISPLVIEQVGIYLWWLCLKIIYNTDEFFFTPHSNSER